MTMRQTRTLKACLVLVVALLMLLVAASVPVIAADPPGSLMVTGHRWENSNFILDITDTRFNETTEVVSGAQPVAKLTTNSFTMSGSPRAIPQSLTSNQYQIVFDNLTPVGNNYNFQCEISYVGRNNLPPVVVQLDITPAEAGNLTVTGYRLENSATGGHFSGEIYKNNSLTVVLSIYDNRPAVAGYTNAEELRPMARLNTASFSYGSTSGVYVSNAVRSVNGKEWTYELRIQNLTYTGVGKSFQCDIFYEGNNTVPVTPYEITLNQLIEYVESSSSSSDSSSSTSAVVKGTGFVLKEANYGQSQITAGQPFTLNATMLATNGDNRVENVSLTVIPAKELSLRDGSSVVYVGTVAPGQDVPASFNLLAPASIAEGSYAVVIDIKGVDAKTGADVKAEVSITVPVVQPERFEIFNTQLPTDLTAGVSDGMGTGSITLVNQGKGAVSNVSVEILGPGLSTEEGKQYVGNVAGGEQKSSDFTILADTPGPIAAQVVVSYESARGEAKTLTYDFTINVMEGMMEDPGMMPPMDPGMTEPEQTGMPVWGWVLIVLGVLLIAIIVLIILLKRHKKKKAAALEDDYEDE